MLRTGLRNPQMPSDGAEQIICSLGILLGTSSPTRSARAPLPVSTGRLATRKFLPPIQPDHAADLPPAFGPELIPATSPTNPATQLPNRSGAPKESEVSLLVISPTQMRAPCLGTLANICPRLHQRATRHGVERQTAASPGVLSVSHPSSLHLESPITRGNQSGGSPRSGNYFSSAILPRLPLVFNPASGFPKFRERV